MGIVIYYTRVHLASLAYYFFPFCLFIYQRYEKEAKIVTPADDTDWVAAALLTLVDAPSSDASNVTTTDGGCSLVYSSIGTKYY